MARKVRTLHTKKDRRSKMSCCHGHGIKNGKQVGRRAKKYKKTVDGLKSDCSVCELQSRSKDVASMVLKAVEAEMGAVGRNPFSFTTSCAPDAQSFHFMCQSCLVVRFATYEELRLHEDWCARIRAGKGFICGCCSRLYRTLGTLRRHSEESHSVADSSRTKKTVVGNPYNFSTTISTDAASFPHMCISCQVVCFSTASDLQKHVNWCGQSVSCATGFKCSKCTRRFRTEALLEQHSAADNCLNTTDDDKIENLARAESCGESTEQTPVVETSTLYACPLCDEPCLNLFEQKIHLLTIHNLTSSELKTKASIHRHSKPGHTHVTCLDCDARFASRLELVQHKRSCTQSILPIYINRTPAGKPSSTENSKKLPCATNRHSSKKDNTTNEDKRNPDKETTPVDISCKSSVALKENSESTKPGSVNCTSVQTKCGRRKSQTSASQKLMLNMTKVRHLVKSTGAKRLLLKPDGELLLLGEGGRKMSSRNGKSLITRTHGNSGSMRSSSKTVNTRSKLVSAGKPKQTTKPPADGSALTLARSGSEAQPIVIDGTTEVTRECQMYHNISAEDTKSAHEVLSSVLTSSQMGISLNEQDTEATGGKKKCKKRINDSDEDIKCEEEWPVVNLKPASVLPVQTSIRKRSLCHEMTPIGDLSCNNSVSTVSSNAAKNNAMSDGVELVPLKRLMTTRNRNSPVATDHRVVTISDSAASRAESEVTITSSVPSSKIVEGQETLLEALKLVPVADKPLVKATATRYRTRSSLAISSARTISKSKSLCVDNSDSSKRLSRYSGRKARECSAASVSCSEQTEASKYENLDQQMTSIIQFPRKQQTVEPIDDRFVRCVTCKMVFQTVRQIVNHVCTS